MENLLSLENHCGYGRPPPMLPQFLLNGDDPNLAILRNQALLFGMTGSMPPSLLQRQVGRALPVMWRPPSLPNMPGNMNSLFNASAACPSWYTTVLASAAGAPGFPRLDASNISMPPTTMSQALALSPHLWSPSAAQSSPQLPLGLTTRKPDPN